MPTLKIITWNIDKISNRVLNRTIGSVVQKCGLGNNTLDYITNFLGGSSVWNNGVQGVPADVIIIIEPRSGRQGKGEPATGDCLTTQTRIITSLNTFITNQQLEARYQYAGVTQQNISPGESLIIIYNRITLEYKKSGALRENKGGWLSPRAPFWAKFTTVANPNTPINIIGIHGPQKGENKGGADMAYNAQLAYADALATIPEIIQQDESVIVAGDYNCSTCARRKKQFIIEEEKIMKRVWGFEKLVELKYTTLIPSPMFLADIPYNIYSSVRKSMRNDETPPLNYLSEAYDTALYHLVTLSNPVQQVNNLIGDAQNTLGTIKNGNQVIENGPLVNDYAAALRKQYQKKVSDHMPTTTLFDYPAQPPNPPG
jgi:hypothetical protein